MPTAPVAHALSIARLVLTPAFLVAAHRALAGPSRAAAAVALPLVALILATDALDGIAARRAGGGTRLGAALDLTADAAFLLSACAVLAATSVAPWWFPALVALKLVEFIATSLLLTRAGTALAFVHDPVGRGAVGATIAVVALSPCAPLVGLDPRGGSLEPAFAALAAAFAFSSACRIRASWAAAARRRSAAVTERSFDPWCGGRSS